MPSFGGCSAILGSRLWALSVHPPEHLGLQLLKARVVEGDLRLQFHVGQASGILHPCGTVRLQTSVTITMVRVFGRLPVGCSKDQRCTHGSLCMVHFRGIRGADNGVAGGLWSIRISITVSCLAALLGLSGGPRQHGCFCPSASPTVVTDARLHVRCDRLLGQILTMSRHRCCDWLIGWAFQCALHCFSQLRSVRILDIHSRRCLLLQARGFHSGRGVSSPPLGESFRGRFGGCGGCLAGDSLTIRCRLSGRPCWFLQHLGRLCGTTARTSRHPLRCSSCWTLMSRRRSLVLRIGRSTRRCPGR
mmetsp:Transcript_6002/g.16852  ORF Transcript_6002/g.16852 Transcript_6002/m.16852 type:complete len:304 (+) Transcript_6002:138-1049(+)